MSTVLPFDFGSSYQAIRKIGQGASGRVFEGVDRVHGDHVAIKILRSDLDDDAQLVQRFVNERRTLTELDHPRIIAVRDLIVDQGMLGIVMELATGPTLGAQLAASGPMAPAAALAVVRQVAEALSYAHGRGVVHRDIKPDNIILTNLDGADDPEVKVADFGIAKILGESSTATHLVGTAHYLAPELIRDNVLSPSVDVYALGVTLYQMVSGQLPFGAGDDNPYAVAERHLHSTPAVIPGLDDQVWGLISGMLAKNPADRLSDDDVASLAGNIIVDVEGQLPLSVPEGTLVPHAMTMLRQPTSLTAHQGDEESVAVTGDRPAPINLENLRTLSRPASATILKAGPELDGETLDDSSVGEDAKESWWSSRTHRIVVGAAGILIIVAVVLWIVVGGGFRGANKQGSKVVDGLSASLPMQTYPSGLSVTRAATVNKGTLKYSLTYRTIKQPLSGDVLEVVTSARSCPDATWDDTAKVVPHSPALTSIDAKCGWTITLKTLPQEEPVTVTAKFPATEAAISNQANLQTWLQNQQQATDKALNNDAVTSTAYSLQRLQTMRIKIPPRVKEGSAIPVTILGTWPGGENEMTPIYTTPFSSNPTSILTDITGGKLENVRLTDRCSGAVSITPDGHDVSALHPTSCSIGAEIGNYQVQETPITIVAGGS
ncbi:hypothetical protein PAST3_01961 [Cutibacterium acnes HL201PA1]|nr:hypothetical protein PAST3_01961 [Cutibacterium acnes HL201PA1]